ncbi:endonuclease/exonuclease/phosphatase family protein [Nocardioides sp.]|uniref:endonuclease/exonuclease/phosphatase family protein n=1 Tax=Nocardioides sp. TaxID=35761 RepID=UPI0035B286D4
MFAKSFPLRALGVVVPAVIAVAVAGTLADPTSGSHAPVQAVADEVTAQAAAEKSEKSASTAVQTTPATFFRAATFNVLGADHTAPGGNRKGWDSGVVRMDRVVTLLGQHDLDVVGFQEFQPPQAQRFNELMGTSWQTYPGLDTSTGAPSVNSIGWRTDTWRLLEARTLPIPYFSGAPSRMPAVLLVNLDTGRRAWFFNTHNPADTRGNAQQWRNAGFAMEVALANELRAAYPDAPFISFGDKNERDEYYCAVAPGANMWSASGGYVDGTTCSAPGGGAIDWIMGTKDVFFNTYTKVWNDYVSKTSDHPLYTTNVVVPASAPVTAEHVVVVAVPGLTSTVVRGLGSKAAELDRMVTNGASTMNARTVKESTDPDANLVSLLSGRRVFPKAGGHGVGARGRKSSTVHAAAGQYVSSIFDLAHNNSLRTSFIASRPEAQLVRRSWNKKSGGKDPYGVDDGTAKFDKATVLRDDAKSVAWWKSKVARRPFDLSVIELSGAYKEGQRSGYTGEAYQRAVRKISQRVASIRRGIAAQPEMQGTTLLVVVGTSGAQRAKKSSSWAESYRVPMWVTGPGVPADDDLYGLNPSLSSPSSDQPNYSGLQPIRTGGVANLVTRVLRLPPVPGSTMDTDQRFQIFDPAALPGA